MKIRTGQVKHLPLSASQEAMVFGEDTIGWSANRLDRSTSAYNHRSLHSTGLRLAVVLSKLSNVKLDTNGPSLESVQSLQCMVKRSSGAAAQADAYLVRLPRVGGQPLLPTPSLI